MKFVAKSRYVSYSPYKLRPIADVIRGKSAAYAIGWLSTYRTRRSLALIKTLESAIANAKHLKNLDPQDLSVAKICVDQGPIHRYFKPGAMGRAMVQRKRTCHISVILESSKEA